MALFPTPQRLARFALISGVVLAADILTKQLALSALFAQPRVIEVTSFFNLVPVWNSGVSFGLFRDYPSVVSWVIPLLACAVILWLISELSRLSTSQQIGAGFIAGGALGNVIDRLRFGRVVDFLDVHLAGYHWPAFNLADAAIFIGAMLWLYGMIQGERTQDR